MAPLGAMNSNLPEVGVTDLLEKYMNTSVSAFLLRLSAFFADKNDQANTRTKKIVHEVLNTVKFGVFPLVVLNNPNAKVEDFFDVEKLKDFFKKIWEHHEKKKLGSRKFHVYIKWFRKSLRYDKIAEKVGQQESADVHKFLEAAQRYYKSNRDGANIDNFISFDRLPAFLSTFIRNYINLDHLKVVLNNQLNKRTVTKEQILDCIKFTPLLVEFGCTAEKQATMDLGLRGLCCLLLDWAADDKLAAEKLMRYIGNGYLVDRAAGNVPPQPTPPTGQVPPAQQGAAQAGQLVVRK